MNFLDDRITFTFTFAPGVSSRPAAGMYRYGVYSYDAENDDDILKFSGNYYYNRERYYTFDVTDIIRSCKQTIPNEYFTSLYVNGVYQGCLYDKYKVIIFSGNTVLSSSTWETVAMCYRYPNYTSRISGNNVYLDPYNSSAGAREIPLQGLKYVGNKHQYMLVPHYPLCETYIYKYAQNFEIPIQSDTIQLFFERDHYSDSTYFDSPDEKNGVLFVKTIGDMFPWDNDQDFDQGDGDLIVTESETRRKIAIFDECYARYYLFWQDRLGGYQSQAFKDNIQYSETIKNTETINYQDERNKSFVQVQPKWSLKSGWIDEDVYPIYESIMVSPVVLLYDSHEDRLHEVIVNTNFTEKTFKNSKKLLNLNLDLEGVTKQNIIY